MNPLLDPVRFVDGIGCYSYYLLVPLVLYQISARFPHVYAFLVGAIFNGYLNHVLKAIVRQPRPSNPVLFEAKEDYYNHGPNRFGFPSGHAQYAFYMIGYLYWMSRRVTRGVLLCAAIGAITLYQRYKYRRHTVEQLAAGTAVGLGFSWVVYQSVEGFLRYVA